MRDLGCQDPVADRPRHDLGSLLVAAVVPISRRRVPRQQAAELEETIAVRPRHVLVDPDVPHLVQEVPASHLVHEHRADVDMTILGVAEVSSAAGGVRMEGDLDPRGV